MNYRISAALRRLPSRPGTPGAYPPERDRSSFRETSIHHSSLVSGLPESPIGGCRRSSTFPEKTLIEVLLEGDWFPVVRYDSKHGFAHVDWITRSGETQKQLLPLPFAEALTHADKDILDHWRDYQLHFYQGD